MTTRKSHTDLLPHLFRQEFSKMTAVLCRHFGFKHIELAEDIAGETFLKATELWATNGIPENPTAWLYTVAKNKAKDYLKHRHIVEEHVKGSSKNEQVTIETEFEFTDAVVADSQLAMMFAVSNATVNSTGSQICLALQILCGFSIEEIANAFLTSMETVKKRLQRARSNLRAQQFQFAALNANEIQAGLTTVLRTLYLLFNEGYFSKTSSELVRKDLCSEAIRLALVLKENPLTDVPQTNALLALMCFQSSRIEARRNATGGAVLFEAQDKRMWDKDLIDKGNYYLAIACQTHTSSKYHLEAAIGYWHACGEQDEKWNNILQLYNALIKIEGSPVTAYNRVFAVAKVHGAAMALEEMRTVKVIESNYYYSLMGYLTADADREAAIRYYQHALNLTNSVSEKQQISMEIQRLESRQ